MDNLAKMWSWFRGLKTLNKLLVVLAIAVVIRMPGYLLQPEWQKQHFDSQQQYDEFLAGGFGNRFDYLDAKDRGVGTASEWEALVEAERQQEEARLLAEEQDKARAAEAGFASVEEMKSAAEAGFSTKAQWLANQEEERRQQAAAQGAEARQKYGCIPTVLVEYTCDYDPRRQRQTQHFCFDISHPAARDRVISSCQNSIFHQRGGGATIHSVRDF